MNEIRVSCQRAYSVLIGRGALGGLASLVKDHAKADKYCIISDDNVAPLYADRVGEQLALTGAEVYRYVFPHGEGNKTLDTVGGILEYLATAHFTRSDCLVALGGGIVGDVCGFAASVYMRGIRFIQIPTTLLAAVDSSVGGKTGVNLGGLKNQVGAFWQPSLVVCDPETFATLPADEYRNGMAEVIKYAAICDPRMVDILSGEVSDIIARCVSIKSDIVSRDEHDHGERMLLNYGHTFGHAVEFVSEERIPHGMAVAIGMMTACRAAEMLGIAERGTADATARVLSEHGLPLCVEGYSADELYSAMLNDKKRAGGEVTLVLPERFGKCVLKKVKLEYVRDFFQL